MLIKFDITNFRSIKEKVSLSLAASGEVNRLKEHPENLVSLDKHSSLTRSAILFGRNASGKSNILMGFRALEYLILKSGDFQHDRELDTYEPFAFNEDNLKLPTEFEIEFVAKSRIRYSYCISFNEKGFTKEILSFYPKGRIANLFTREANGKITYGEHYKGERKAIEENLLPNQLFLSKASKNNIEYLKDAFLFFSETLSCSIFHETHYDEALINAFAALMHKSSDSEYTNDVKKLIKAADTNIVDFTIDEQASSKFVFPQNMPDKLRKELLERYKYSVNTLHKVYKGEKEVGLGTLKLEDESLGTKRLLVLSTLIVHSLSKGGVLIVDELDKNLHPLITKMLVKLFHSEKTNPSGAQLIFATHDSSLLDRDVFRRDQIWFVEKDFDGSSRLYNLSEFPGIRKGAPFDKWYLSGKFGGIPVTEEIDFSFSRD